MTAHPLDSGAEVNADLPDALSAGDPLRSHFPPGTQIREHQDGIELQDPSRPDVLLYQRANVNGSYYFGTDHGKACMHVRDIVITGEVLGLYDRPGEWHLTFGSF